MGKFKTPFSSQPSQERSVKRKVKRTTATSRKQAKPSPLRLGRVDVVTPETKHKIKQRFAAGLAQLQGDIRDTSPGVPVPFSLSQSQPATSQMSGAALGESQETVTYDPETDTVDDTEGSAQQALRVESADNSQASNNTAVPEEFYLLFDDEEDDESNPIDAAEETTKTVEENEKHATVDQMAIAASAVAAKVIEIAGSDADGCCTQSKTDDTRLLDIHVVATKQNKGNCITKPKMIKHTPTTSGATGSKPAKSKVHACTTNKDGQRHGKEHTTPYSEYEFDCSSEKTSKLVVDLGFQSKKKRGHGRALHRISMKKAVLLTIDKMHREIEELQKRRRGLIQGKDAQTTSTWKSKVALPGALFEE